MKDLTPTIQELADMNICHINNRRIKDILEEENECETADIARYKQDMAVLFHKDDWHKEMIADTDLGCFGMEFKQ